MAAVHDELKMMTPVNVVEAFGQLPLCFVGSPTSKPCVSKHEVGWDRKHNGWQAGVHDTSGWRILVVARKASVKFVQQVGADGVSPTCAGVIVPHVTIC